MVAQIQNIDRISNIGNSLPEDRAVEFDKLQLIASLQSTLDLEQMLRHFHEGVNKVLRVDGLLFHEEGRDISYKLGKQSTHSCGYHLVTDSASYGELIFKRSKRFSEAEFEQIENLLVLLIVPISNALKYFDAVRQAILEPATKVGNRIAMESSLQREIELAKRHNQPLSLMTIQVASTTQKKSSKLAANVVTKLTGIIQKVSRSTDMLFRTGEREFRLIMLNDASGATPIARRIEKLIQRSFDHDDADGFTVNTGFTSLTGTDSAKSLVGRIKNQIHNSA